MASGARLGQSRKPNCEVACAMFDVIMLALVIVYFALAAAYANLCKNLLGRPDKDVSP